LLAVDGLHGLNFPLPTKSATSNYYKNAQIIKKEDSLQSQSADLIYPQIIEGQAYKWVEPRAEPLNNPATGPANPPAI